MDTSASKPEYQGCASQISNNKKSNTELIQQGRLPKVIHHAQTISAELPNASKQDTHEGVSCFFNSTHFPSTQGVVEFIAHNESTILLAATGNIRDFITKRLNEHNPPKIQSTPKVNLASITARIIAYPAGSRFESDWIVHERARSVDPDLWAKLNEQNRMAMLILDPRDGTWSVQDTLRFKFGNQHQILIAPIRTSKAAQALGETLDDVFELCRYPKELAKAPDGTPCAYKEMGRCPGACDGSESMGAYTGRLAQAIKAASAGIERWKTVLQSQIEHASAKLDFEHAQILQRQLDQVNKLPINALGHARTLTGICCVCITPAVRKGWAMIWIYGNQLGHQGLIPLAGVDASASGLEKLIERWQSPIGDTPAEFDQLAFIARFWLSKPARARRRRLTILDLRETNWQQRIASAIAQACVPVDSEQADEEQTHIIR